MTSTTEHLSERQLVPVIPTGRLGGLGNLVRKELGQWRGTRLWWIQTVIWLVMLNGITAVLMLDGGGMSATELVAEAVQTFLLVGATAIPIGIVITIQGAVVGEKELGTAEWVLSKPVSRASFVVSKVIAHTVGFLVTAVAIPSAVFAIEARYLLAEPVDWGRFATGTAVLALVVLFYVTFTLALGCIFKGRGPVAGIGIGLILTGQFFKGMLPLGLVQVTPWLLGDVASSFALDTQLEWNRLVPVVATVIATAIFLIAAVYRFDREEF